MECFSTVTSPLWGWQRRWDTGSCGERFVWENVLHHPHVFTQCGPSSGWPATLNLQPDSPCACNLVISPVSALCVPQAGLPQLLPSSSVSGRSHSPVRVYRVLRIRGEHSSYTLSLSFTDDGTDPRRLSVMWPHPTQGHMSYPPDLCPFDSLGSLHYLATIFPTGDSPLWNYWSPIQVSYPWEKCNLDQPKCKLSDSYLSWEMAVSRGAAGMGLLLNKRWTWDDKMFSGAWDTGLGPCCKRRGQPFVYVTVPSVAVLPPNLP